MPAHRFEGMHDEEPTRRLTVMDAPRHQYPLDTAAPFDIVVRDSAGQALNHTYGKRVHMRSLATDAAPGPPIAPRRRRIDVWGLLSTLAGLAVIALAILGAAVMLGRIAP